RVLSRGRNPPRRRPRVRGGAEGGAAQAYARPRRRQLRRARLRAEARICFVLNSDAEAAAVSRPCGTRRRAHNYLLVGCPLQDAPGRYVTRLCYSRADSSPRHAIAVLCVIYFNSKVCSCQPLAEAGYARWQPNKPDSPDVERCGSMAPNALLNDIQCTNPMSFICEYEY
ncbi:Hemolymph lipopolysaccharide-binding protein, partial [Gryllus bimaculatus]